MGKARIPLYLPDRTVIGDAAISNEGHTIVITIPSITPIPELILDDLVGLSVVYMTNEARDRMNEGETTDDGQQRRAS